jgi:hypothetical protein
MADATSSPDRDCSGTHAGELSVGDGPDRQCRSREDGQRKSGKQSSAGHEELHANSRLSPGVVAGVYNAGELGPGGIALSQISKSNDGIYVHGARSYENNWQLDGVSVSDVRGNETGSGSVPILNPDVIQEFKVQTGLYDAAYGRYAGANVRVITMMGGNAFHGTIFEFLRNDVLNANDFFFNKTGLPRLTLKQNQFGLAT